MVVSWFTIAEQWSYMGSILALALGGVVLYRKTKAVSALVMSIFVSLYVVGYVVLRLVNVQFVKLRQAGPFELAQSSWWYVFYSGHAMQALGLAVGCAAFLVFAVRYQRALSRF